MGDAHVHEEDPVPLPTRLFERLAQVPGYTWDETIRPFHTSYDHWHVVGVYHNQDSTLQQSSSTLSSLSNLSHRSSGSNRSSPKLDARPSIRQHWSSISGASITDSEASSSKDDPVDQWIPIVARISTHVLRCEREFNANRKIVKELDPECSHTVRAVDLFRLPPHHDDPAPMIVTIWESPGNNFLRELVDFGPAWWGLNHRKSNVDLSPSELVPVLLFLDFAIGACECLELLHHGAHAIHGEIRQDAFHWHRETNTVKLVNGGNGPRSFENLLSSEGWSNMSKELGVSNKLQYVAPEQTGRLAAEPDSRTDIYSLGVLFWILLTGRPAYEADSPLDIVQKVLSQRLPAISSIRMDLPDVLSHVVAKMTQKQMDDRYHSINGLKYDLIQIAKFMGEGDQDKLRNYRVAQHDVSAFFILPSKTVGRQAENDRVFKILEKFHKRQNSDTRSSRHKAALNSNASNNSSISDGHGADGLEVIDGSDSSSSLGFKDSRSNSTTIGLDGQAYIGRNLKFPTIGRGIAEPRNGSIEQSDHESSLSAGYPNQHSDNQYILSRRRDSHQFKRRGRAEVIHILGGQGVGKTTLLKTAQSYLRRHGYIAMSRFDRARPTPFEPLLKALGSLFRQIFSERDVSTTYHENVRSHVKPLWPILHSTLDLPESLIETSISSKRNINNTDSSAASVKTEVPATEISNSSTTPLPGLPGRDTNDFLRGPATTKSIRLMTTYMDVLRLICSGKVICLCFDDVQSADVESIELLQHIIRAKIPVVLMLASRIDAGHIAATTQRLLDVDSTNKIELLNLKEKHIFEYVAATMAQEVETVLPLAAVVHEKSGGNPFLTKEILQTLYQKNCLWYDWKTSGWAFDLDKIFDELSGQHGSLDNDFITRKLHDLCPSARSILAWASLVGTNFSYKLISTILTGEYFYSSGKDQAHDATCPKRAKLLNFSESDLVDGLQTLCNMYIITPGDTDDEFRFAHARYLHAANKMRECQNITKMHFIITQTMMSYLSDCRYNLYPLARHICLSWEIIKHRMSSRARYRDVLWRGANKAAESGAFSTALWYFQTCIRLLQDDHWNSAQADVFYDETLQLYVHTAEMLVKERKQEEALKMLQSTFEHARCAADKTRSWILQGRILAKIGKFEEAFFSLKQCLIDLGVQLPPTTWDECDIDYKKLEYRLRGIDRAELTSRPISQDRKMIALGTALSEAISTVYWYDSLSWYQLVNAYVNILLDQGIFVQAGLGFNQLASVAIVRFKDIELAMMYGDIAKEYYDLVEDPWTRARGWTLYTLFVGHFHTSLRSLLPVLETALEYSLVSGDRVASILNIGAMAVHRLWVGQDLGEVEAFVTYGPEEFLGWEEDLRGGTLLVSTRQLARCLQGKTFVDSVDTLLDDENWSQKRYLSGLVTAAPNATRPRDLFRTLTLMAYYVYGHYDYVVAEGRDLMQNYLNDLWSNRPVVITHFFFALACLAKASETDGEEKNRLIEDAKASKQLIDLWGSEHDVNFLAMSRILAAQIAVVTKAYYDVIGNLESAIDHAQVHGFAIEEAVAIELQAEFVLARGSKRGGKVMIQEAISAWNRINALGKARQLAEKHEWLLKTATTARTIDSGTQTFDVAALAVVEEKEENEKKESTNRWIQPKPASPVRTASNNATEVPGLGLDILDLTSILEFSRVISSELQISSLLSKMTSVILESVGGQAEFCAIVIDSEDRGWCVAASGDHENGVKTYPDGIPFAEVDDQVAQQITHYLLRTKETLFLPNVLEDERFGNVSDAYLARNPNGRAVICIPIIQADHLMGVIHLEGRPYAFTQRNMVVLNLLTNQVAISLGNALLYRKVRKVSASNASMVESQKRALAAARAAEAKAKKAEAEATHNLHLSEESAKAKSIFLANVSHELRTPLNGVIGMSELLKGTPLSKDQEGYADSIRVCADTLLTVINDILDFSKLEAGKMQMFTVPLNLKETITEVVRALAYTNQEHGLETLEELDIEEGLVLGDPVRLHQIFMNLLSNAYKFTPKGSVTIRAKKVAETKEKVKITCSVADTGIGITQEQLTRLFQPFSQADSSTARSYGGSGLGLSICKAMIENVLGGKIWIESEIGVGTTVFFTITFKKAPKESSISDVQVSARDPDPMASWSQSTTPAAEEPKPRGVDLSRIPKEDIRVCIAEDNAINRKIAVSYVKKLGFYNEAFEDGKLAYEALQKASKAGNPFHIVLMDVQMPVLDGYEATKAIRKDADPQVNKVLIIAMTASAIRGDREKCLEAGMNDYLAKPVRQTVLKAMLDEYLTKPSVSKPGESKQLGGMVTPGDKAHQLGDPMPRKTGRSSGTAGIETAVDANGKSDSATSSGQLPSRNADSNGGTNTSSSGSPPSGKREMDQLGRVSQDELHSTTKKSAPAVNGHAQTGSNGSDEQKS